MSRNIKRVPLDFDWPLGVNWPGFVSPSDGTGACPLCIKDHPGYSTEATAIVRVARVIPERIENQGESTRKFLRALASATERRKPEAEQREVGEHPYNECIFLDTSAIGLHLVRLVEDALGVSLLCPDCKGEGFVVVDQAQADAAERWKPEEPPVGEGWQVWESVGTGAPITPVYPTAEALVEALMEGAVGWDGPVSRKAAEEFVRAGWAPSGAMIDGVMYDGVASFEAQGAPDGG